MTAPYALILLTWNQWALTRDCLKRLGGLSRERWAIWVVDNGSAEAPPLGFEALHPSLRLLRLAENLGFAGGCNRGAEAAFQAGASAAVFLNNDASTTPEDLERLAGAVSQGPWGIVGAVNYSASAPDKIFSTGQRFVWALCRLQRLTSLSPGETPQPVPGIVGSCFATSRKLFETVGLLDQRFFIYYEEADLCVRAFRAGFRVGYHPQVKVLHEGLTSFGRQSPATLYLYTRNLGLFMSKQCPKMLLPFCLLSYGIQAFLKSVLLAVRGKREGACAVWAGVFDFLGGRYGGEPVKRFVRT